MRQSCGRCSGSVHRGYQSNDFGYEKRSTDLLVRHLDALALKDLFSGIDLVFDNLRQDHLVLYGQRLDGAVSSEFDVVIPDRFLVLMHHCRYRWCLACSHEGKVPPLNGDIYNGLLAGGEYPSQRRNRQGKCDGVAGVVWLS